jgi:hypothetical protein
MSESMAVAIAGQGTDLDPLAARASDYFRGAKAATTVACYARDWLDFCCWCAARGRPGLPAEPETVVLYLTDLAESRKVATLEKRLAGG